MPLARRFTALVPVFLLAVLTSPAQQSSGLITGTVHDTHGAVVPGAKVVLVNQDQGAVFREVPTSLEGTFVLTPVPPATYTLTVEASGFKKYVKADLHLFANDRLSLPPVVLELGQVDETITVSASAVVLQTASAERSGVLTGGQVRDLGLANRDWNSLLKTVAGNIPGSDSMNGQRAENNSYNVDGASTMDTGSNSMNVRMNVDAIAEFKVVSNGQQAEFGRSSGANITLVTKSGTRDFHGTGYWFHRHEGLNANTWLNNYSHRPRGRYRYNTQGFNLGGPFYIPGKFNTDRQKLFFFVAFEWQRQLLPPALYTLTVPTAAERKGDFFLTHEANGQRVTIKDPTTGNPFPGNQIPSTRWNGWGEKILNFYPLPNFSGDPSYNYTSQFSAKSPQQDEIYRVDYNISNNWRVYFRLLRNTTNGLAPYGGLNSGNNLGISAFRMPNGAYYPMGNVTTIISPTLTNEFSYSNGRNYLPVEIGADGGYLRSKTGLNIPLPFSNADPAGIIPNLLFGGVPNPPISLFTGLPYANENPVVNWTDNVAKVFPKHTLKAGVFIEKTHKTQSAYSIANGTINFDRDVSNPGDTNWAFSNALLGNFRSVQQSDKYRVGNLISKNFEWYVQDNWKVSSKLTLDFGIRFAVLLPTYDERFPLSGFSQAAWNPAQAVKLYQKAGKNASLNPLTGATGPAILVGAIVPGSGNADNGLVTERQNGYPEGLMDERGLHYAPRFGLAWTPVAKTVIRLGGGVFYERIRSGQAQFNVANPPGLRTVQVLYGNLDTYTSSAQTQFPVASNGIARDERAPTVYNYNLSIQRELPLGVLLDMGYVGSQSRHLYYMAPVNEPPFGSAWLPQNQDPTVTPRFDGTTTLPVDFTRPYPGFSSLQVFTTSGSANYNALQISANRRMSRSLSFGLAYTWSKALGVQGTSGTNVLNNTLMHPTDVRHANYGPLQEDRTQVLTFNYIYNLPDFVHANGSAGPRVAGFITNGWQIAGITSFSSGSPTMISYTVQGVGAQPLNRMITGSETQAPRVVITGNPNLSPGDRKLERFIDGTAFAPAPKGSVGLDSSMNPVRGPGINNWDISVLKKIAFSRRSEQRFIQLRLEMFNAFNHTQWSGFNPVAQFNSAGKITNLPTALGGGGGRFGFGALNAVRDPRVVQVAAKVYF